MDRLSDADLDRWLVSFGRSPEPAYRLVCFPHAGGSASSYHPLSAALPASVQVLGVQYPGRQERRDEPVPTDLESVADRMCQVLRERMREPYVLFGHSMGAVIAYEVARRLEGDAGGLLDGVIVSGRRAPSIHRDEGVHRGGDEALIAELRKLSGTDQRLLLDDEILQLILPAIRGDYRAIETYRHIPGNELTVHLSVFVGNSDPRVDAADAKEWQRHTSGQFSMRSFNGGHFYLNTQWDAVAKAVLDDLGTFARQGH